MVKYPNGTPSLLQKNQSSPFIVINIIIFVKKKFLFNCKKFNLSGYYQNVCGLCTKLHKFNILLFNIKFFLLTETVAW